MSLVKKPALIILFLLTLLSGIAQEPFFVFSRPYEKASSDPLGNFYLIQEGQIDKADSLGNILSTFSDPDLGDITWLDASDPFRLLIYYKDFNQIIYLDRTLSPLGDPVYLDDLDIFHPIGICRASQGGFWLIDNTNGSLIHLDAELNPKVKTRLSGMTARKQDIWLPMLEWSERLYVSHRGSGIQQFDLFGTALKNIPAPAKAICVFDKSLLFIGDTIIYQYFDFPPSLSQHKSFILPEYKSLNISKNRALLRNGKGWGMYHLKKTDK